MILVDTPLWSLALRRRIRDLGPEERDHVSEWRRLVRDGEAALIGPIRQEVLSGIRDDRIWGRLREALWPFPDLRISSADYERAAQFFNRCRSAGITGGPIDMLICSVAAGSGTPVYTLDSDFERYAGVLELELELHKLDTPSGGP